MAEPTPSHGDGKRGRPGRWLGADWRYLVRELAIVFVGVVVALAVNDWSLGRDEEAREREYLGRMAAELAADSAELQNLFVPGVEAKLVGLAAVRPYVAGQDLSVPDTLALVRHLSMAGRFGFGVYMARRITFEDMQGTGSLRLVRDPELRWRIVQHFSNSARGSDLSASRRAGYAMFFSGLIPGELFREEVTLQTIRPYDPARVLQRVRSEEAHDMVNQEVSYALYLRRLYREQETAGNNLLRELRATLGEAR